MPHIGILETPIQGQRVPSGPFGPQRVKITDFGTLFDKKKKKMRFFVSLTVFNFGDFGNFSQSGIRTAVYGHSKQNTFLGFEIFKNQKVKNRFFTKNFTLFKFFTFFRFCPDPIGSVKKTQF